MRKRKIISALLISILLGVLFLVGCQTKTKDVTTKQESNQESTVDKVDENIISTKELSSRLYDSQLVIIDIRSEAEYIGWKLQGESRGGHIKGAVDFPIEWTKDEKGALRDANELSQLLEKRGIVKEKSIVIYDSAEGQSNEMAEILNGLDYENVQIYKAGLIEWASDDTLPMDKLSNYEKLVYPAWINELITNKNPDTYSGNEFRIFEVSWGAPKDYDKGHIPGAFHLDTNEIEEEPLWNRVSDEAIEDMLLRNGITYDTTVILYGSDTTAAARAASIMMYAGVKDVRLLNGGFAAWQASGYDIDVETHEPTPVVAFGTSVPAHPEYIIDTEEAKAILDDENSKLVSIRSWPEYIGETSGYTYIEPKGRIKGAVWGHAGSDAYHMEDYRNIDNTMANYHEIAANWEEWGITSDKRVAFYCGTGWRASEAFFAAYLMGWENIAVYDGGWYEWSMDESNPIEIGEPQK